MSGAGANKAWAEAKKRDYCWRGGEVHLWRDVEGTAEAQVCRHCGTEQNAPARTWTPEVQDDDPAR